MSNVLAELRDDRPAKDHGKILSFQFQGYIIQVGKNSFSNERLVAEHPHRDCLWLHAMAARGSHVILCWHGRPDPEEAVISYAAALALTHSHSLARTVSVARLKDIIKPEDAGTGVWKPTKAVSLEVPE